MPAAGGLGAVPRVTVLSRLAVIINAGYPAAVLEKSKVEAAARTLGIALQACGFAGATPLPCRRRMVQTARPRMIAMPTTVRIQMCLPICP